MLSMHKMYHYSTDRWNYCTINQNSPIFISILFTPTDKITDHFVCFMCLSFFLFTCISCAFIFFYLFTIIVCLSLYYFVVLEWLFKIILRVYFFVVVVVEFVCHIGRHLNGIKVIRLKQNLFKIFEIAK